ncbi:pentatricopeptide repeat-containing protein At3g12770-like [Aristolochia californica]|uniref:pentatricopeptide repeat-containing protein At3g12770-like n=1 Tax=Aristolochia californica TaxID=171875 RepID=UPI0035E31515
MREALDVLELMKGQGMNLEPSLFCILLWSCADEQNLEIGRVIHAKITEYAMEEDAFMANNLIYMYAKCGDLNQLLGVPHRLFDKMPTRNKVSWTSVISMYNQCGHPKESLQLYRLMKSASDIKPNGFTYATVLDCCPKTRNLKMGMEIHEDVIRDGFEGDGYCILETALRQGKELHCLIIKFGFKMGARTLSSLILLYTEANKMAFARHLFEDLVLVDMELWHRMISGYVKNGMNQEAWLIFSRMLSYNTETDRFVFSHILSAWDAILNLDEVKQILAWFSKGGCGLFDASVRGNLVNLYSGLGEFVRGPKIEKMAVEGGVIRQEPVHEKVVLQVL